MSETVKKNARCACGVKLPAHLHGLVTKHVCSCGRCWKADGDMWRQDGKEKPITI